MDGELDEIRVWTVARSLNELVGGMHKTMPDNGAFSPTPKRLLLSTSVSNARKTGGRVSPRLQGRRVAHGASIGGADHTAGGVWGTFGDACGAQRQLPCGSRAAGTSIVDHASVALQAHCSAKLGRDQVRARGLQEDFWVMYVIEETLTLQTCPR